MVIPLRDLPWTRTRTRFEPRSQGRILSEAELAKLCEAREGGPFARS
jgi:hypothetical protein